MPLRFQRRFRIAPGISLNFSEKSVSASFGRRGAHFTVGPRTQRTTFGLSGSGLYYTIYQKGKPRIFLVIAIAGIILLATVLRH